MPFASRHGIIPQKKTQSRVLDQLIEQQCETNEKQRKLYQEMLHLRNSLNCQEYNIHDSRLLSPTRSSQIKTRLVQSQQKRKQQQARARSVSAMRRKREPTEPQPFTFQSQQRIGRRRQRSSIIDNKTANAKTIKTTTIKATAQSNVNAKNFLRRTKKSQLQQQLLKRGSSMSAVAYQSRKSRKDNNKGSTKSQMKPTKVMEFSFATQQRIQTRRMSAQRQRGTQQTKGHNPETSSISSISSISTSSILDSDVQNKTEQQHPSIDINNNKQQQEIAVTNIPIWERLSKPRSRRESRRTKHKNHRKTPQKPKRNAIKVNPISNVSESQTRQTRQTKTIKEPQSNNIVNKKKKRKEQTIHSNTLKPKTRRFPKANRKQRESQKSNAPTATSKSNKLTKHQHHNTIVYQTVFTAAPSNAAEKQNLNILQSEIHGNNSCQIVSENGTRNTKRKARQHRSSKYDNVGLTEQEMKDRLNKEYANGNKDWNAMYIAANRKRSKSITAHRNSAYAQQRQRNDSNSDDSSIPHTNKYKNKNKKRRRNAKSFNNHNLKYVDFAENYALDALLTEEASMISQQEIKQLAINAQQNSTINSSLSSNCNSNSNADSVASTEQMLSDEFDSLEMLPTLDSDVSLNEILGNELLEDNVNTLNNQIINEIERSNVVNVNADAKTDMRLSHDQRSNIHDGFAKLDNLIGEINQAFAI